MASNVAWVSYYGTIKANSAPYDIRPQVNQKYAEIGTELDELGIKVDYQHLDYECRTKNYQDSSAASFSRGAKGKRKAKGHIGWD